MKIPGTLILLLLYIVAPLAQAWVFLSVQPFADLVDTLNFGASIVAYYWLLANVLMGLKIPILQNSLPYDLRIRFHVWSTLGLVVFVGWHAIYTIFLKAKDINLVSWSLLVVFALMLLLSLLWIPLPGFRTLRTKLVGALRFGLMKSYDWLKASHKALFFLLAGLTYIHILDAEVIDLVPTLSGVVYQGLFLLTAVAFVWTRIQNLTLPTLEVRTVANEGGIVRMTLAPHGRLNYRSGQFAFLRFQNPELKGEEHPFSFTSARHEGSVGFAIRPLGDFTNKLAHLKPGDKVRVNGGFGAFYPSKGTGPLALIGSGIGAAPLVSILKELGQQEPNREVVCLLSVNRRDELIEPEILESLTKTMANLKLRVFVFEEDPQLYGPELFSRELGQPERFEYYLCSSDRVRGIIVQALTSLGVPRNKLHFEAFNLG